MAGEFRLKVKFSLGREWSGRSVLTTVKRLKIITNYWLRRSMMWRILQIEEDAIEWDRIPRWITSSEICIILHIIRKPNLVNAKYCKVLNMLTSRLWRISRGFEPIRNGQIFWTNNNIPKKWLFIGWISYLNVFISVWLSTQQIFFYIQHQSWQHLFKRILWA